VEDAGDGILHLETLLRGFCGLISFACFHVPERYLSQPGVIGRATFYRSEDFLCRFLRAKIHNIPKGAESKLSALIIEARVQAAARIAILKIGSGLPGVDESPIFGRATR